MYRYIDTDMRILTMIKTEHFTTAHNINVTYQKKSLDLTSLDHLSDHLASKKGMLLSSGINYPGRYNRWEYGFMNPPVEIIATFEHILFQALNPRGEVLLVLLKPLLNHPNIEFLDKSKTVILSGNV